MSEKIKKEPSVIKGWMLRLVRVLVDVGIGLVILWLFKDRLLKLVFGLDVQQIYAFVKANPTVIQWIVWPTTILVALLAFRDEAMRILDQIPSFVQRAQYGTPIVPTPKKVECVGTENGENGVEGEDKNGVCSKEKAKSSATKETHSGPKNKAAPAQKMTVQRAERLANLAVRRIAEDYGYAFSGSAQVRGTGYVFDSILQNGQDLYGVEVKCGYNSMKIEKTLRELRQVPFSLAKDMRNRFRIILCVVSLRDDDGWREDLMHKVEDTDLIIRTFSAEELERA